MRRKLKNMKWEHARRPNPSDHGDLESHFACGKRAATWTLKDGIAKAIPTARKIGAVRLATQRKLKNVEHQHHPDSTMWSREHPTRKELEKAPNRDH